MSNQKRSLRKRVAKILRRRSERRQAGRDLRDRVFETWLSAKLDEEEQASLFDFMEPDYGLDYEVFDEVVEPMEPEEPYAEDLDWWYGFDDY